MELCTSLYVDHSSRTNWFEQVERTNLDETSRRRISVASGIRPLWSDEETEKRNEDKL